MISINRVGGRVAAALIVATAAAIVVGPAVAACKDACAPTRTEISARLATTAHVRVLAREAQLLHAVVTVHRDKLAALESDVETLRLKRCQPTRYLGESAEGRHPLTIGIDVLATFARLPGQAAIAAQHTLAALAKVTPRVLRAVL